MEDQHVSVFLWFDMVNSAHQVTITCTLAEKQHFKEIMKDFNF